jgi:DNA-binding transcriptional ArsR family regulator
MSRDGAFMAEIAALVGNPARANILSALMDGGSLSAGELAFAAGVSPPTASGHLAMLSDAGLVLREKRGRQMHYRLASREIGHMLESIMAVAVVGAPRQRPWRGEESLRIARTCYDHLAGHLGVALADALTGRGHVLLGEDGGEVTKGGAAFLAGFGLELQALSGLRRSFCRPCLDWSERRPHLAGALGAALAARSFELGWIGRLRDTRAVAITPAGRRGFADRFGIELAG